MTNSTSLLALMQISDSAFPSGAFVHSYGLEQLVRERRVTDAVGLERFVTSVLHESLGRADARAAYAAACARNLEEVVETDQALFATKATAELRAACVATGRRFLEEAFPLSLGERAWVRAGVPIRQEVSSYLEAVHQKETPSCYPVAYGSVCRQLGVDASNVPGAFLLGAVTAILQSSLRLMRVSHRDVQTALHTLRPQISSIADDIADGLAPTGSPPILDLRSFNPLQDIAAMRHERAEARLFAS
jgi:urease accessory protein